jgi:hypothetical protein
MHKFSVSVEDFYRTFSFTTPRIDACMQELVARYELTGKSVLSVGAGAGYEEKQFAIAGNDLLLIDIDEGGSLLLTLKGLPEKPGLSYWIGDAAEFELGVGSHDVVYFSSFTPDELRRASIVRDNADQGRPWAVSDDPFHPVVMAYMSALKENGLFILQSYNGGLDTAYNLDYIAACRRQLAEHNLHLVEVHRFKQTHGVMLYTAVKGKPRPAPALKISQFHGRAAMEPVERIFAASTASIAATQSLPSTTSDTRRHAGGALHRTVSLIRYASQRTRGYRSANPYWKHHEMAATAALTGTIEEIVGRLPESRWKTVTELNCGRGRNVPALRPHAEQVWGVDVLPPELVGNVDRYICAEPGDDCSLSRIGDDEIDATFVLNCTGFGPSSTWRAYFSPFNERFAPYLEPQNLPRALAKGGLLIACEWEAEPEARWGRTSLDEIGRRAAAEYDPPSLEGFELVACGFARSTRSPFVVYRRS